MCKCYWQSAGNNCYYSRMFKHKIIQAILLLTVLITPIAATTYAYQSQASTSNYYSSFTLNYTSSGVNIGVLVNPSGYSGSYKILLWRPIATAPS